MMSMFSFIPKTVAKKAVEYKIEVYLTNRKIGNAAMNVAKTTLINSQNVSFVCKKQIITSKRKM